MFEHYGLGKRRWTTHALPSSPWPWCCRPSAPDAAVNKVTPRLFAAFPTPAAMAAASSDEVAEIIHSLGFFLKQGEEPRGTRSKW